MKFTSNFQMDGLDAEIFNNFAADFDPELDDDLLNQINPEPLDVSDLEDWDDEDDDLGGRF
jgi:hypothetical protein